MEQKCSKRYLDKHPCESQNYDKFHVAGHGLGKGAYFGNIPVGVAVHEEPDHVQNLTDNQKHQREFHVEGVELVHEEDQHQAGEHHQLCFKGLYVQEIVFLVYDYEFDDSEDDAEIEEPFQLNLLSLPS